MSLAALANLLDGGSIRRRFHGHPLGRAAELLLQERVPSVVPLVSVHESAGPTIELPRAESDLVSRRLTGYETPTPRTHLISNGQYSVMLTSTGGGYSRFRDQAVTRWRSDPTCDQWGQFLYLRDVRTGRTWSATYQPTRARPDAYHVTYSIDKAEYHRRDGAIETHLEVAVSPESAAEMRLLKLTNYGSEAVEIEITSYAEVVLAPPAADESHPAFHKLFIETEFVPEELALLARRRPRDASQTVDVGSSCVGARHPRRRWRRIRIEPRTVFGPRPHARCTESDGHGRSPDASHRRRARSRGLAAHARRHPAAGNCHTCVYDRSCCQPRRSAGSGGSVPRTARRAAGLRNGLGLQPGGTAALAPFASQSTPVSTGCIGASVS